MTLTDLMRKVLATAVLAVAGDRADLLDSSVWAALIRLLRSAVLVLLMAVSPGDRVRSGEMPPRIASDIHRVLDENQPPVLEQRIADARHAIAATIGRLLR
jgi:hypothetical protein